MALIDDQLKPSQLPVTPATGYAAAQAAPAPTITASKAAPAQTAAQPAATFTPAQATVGSVQDNQLVSKQLKGLVDENSPLMQQAAAGAQRAAARRGLLNSTMAATAGQSAALGVALPIAQQDAETYRQQALTNQSAQNQYGLANLQEAGQTSRFNAEAAGRTSQFNAELGQRTEIANQEATNRAAEINAANAQQTALSNQQASNRAAEFSASAANEAAQADQKARLSLVLQNMDSQSKVLMSQIEADYKVLMQSSASAAELYQGVMNQISNLQNNKDLSGEARDKLVNQSVALLRTGLELNAAMGKLNLNGLLNFSGVTAPTSTAASGSSTSGSRAYNPGPGEAGYAGNSSSY
jgi:hypothetical protein